MEHLLRSVQFNIDQLFSGNTRISPSSNSGKRKIEISGTLKCPNNLNKPLIPIYSIVSWNFGSNKLKIKFIRLMLVKENFIHN